MKVDEQCKIEHFKFTQFMRLGYEPIAAVQAVDDDIDWHFVEKLIENGCNPETAIRIAR